MRVLVLGGTGVFGRRLCRLLTGDSAISLTIAARDRAAVDAMARELGVAGLAFDWRADLDRGWARAAMMHWSISPDLSRGRTMAWRSSASAIACTISTCPTPPPSCAASNA